MKVSTFNSKLAAPTDINIRAAFLFISLAKFTKTMIQYSYFLVQLIYCYNLGFLTLPWAAMVMTRSALLSRNHKLGHYFDHKNGERVKKRGE